MIITDGAVFLYPVLYFVQATCTATYWRSSSVVSTWLYKLDILTQSLISEILEIREILVFPCNYLSSVIFGVIN
jgi:hypothetical protein